MSSATPIADNLSQDKLKRQIWWQVSLLKDRETDHPMEDTDEEQGTQAAQEGKAEI